MSVICLLQGCQLLNIPTLLGLRSEYFHKKKSAFYCIYATIIPDVCKIAVPGLGLGRETMNLWIILSHSSPTERQQWPAAGVVFPAVAYSFSASPCQEV